MQDDKRIIFDSSKRIINCILILNEVLNNFNINKYEMEKLANEGYVTSTDFADYLVKNLDYPFRKAYNLSAKLVNYCEKNKKKFKELNLTEVKKIDKNLDMDVMKVFDLRFSINSKKSYGGTSFKNIKKMINKVKKEVRW